MQLEPTGTRPPVQNASRDVVAAPRVRVQARRLTKTYDSASAEVAAVRSVDLSVGDGEFVVIMGASGSGKSTLLALLSGLERPTGGEVVLDGHHLESLSETQLALLRRRAAGFVFQAIHLVPNLTMLENVLLPGTLERGNRARLITRARELMGLVGVEGLADRLPSQVSGGEQQRVALARALINEPSVLFVDEPTGALNSANRQRVLDHLARVHRDGQTIILVTHDVAVGARGQRIIFMRDGALTDEIRLGGQGSMPGDRESRLSTWLAAQGW